MSDERQLGPVVSWVVEIDNMMGIVFAPTAAKARYIAVRGYWDAYGRRKGEWPRATCKREPRFDAVSLIAQGRYGPFCRDYVEEALCTTFSLVGVVPAWNTTVRICANVRE